MDKKNTFSKINSLYLLPCVLCVVFLESCFLVGWKPKPVLAQKTVKVQPDTEAVNLNLLQPDNLPIDGSVITADTISQTKLTTPSFWWADEQFGGKLLDNWLAYPSKGRVDLVVNRQLWSLLNYLGRYAFINKMGNVARDYDYNTRVFNQRGKPLGAYTCDGNSMCQVEVCIPGQVPLAGKVSAFCQLSQN